MNGINFLKCRYRDDCFNAGSRTGGRDTFLCTDKEKYPKEIRPDAACFLRFPFLTGGDRGARGNKVSIAATTQTNIIVGVVSHEQNLHDSKTLLAILGHSEASRGKAVQVAVCDRGYQGPKTVGNTQVVLPTPSPTRPKRIRCQRRAAIEPVIGHLKVDYRLSRNFLKGTTGDLVNLLMAASTAWNLSPWLRAFLAFILGGLDKVSWWMKQKPTPLLFIPPALMSSGRFSITY